MNARHNKKGADFFGSDILLDFSTFESEIN